MNVLFIHQNFPGQFVHLAGALAKEPGNRVVALTINWQPAPAGVEVRPYALLRPAAADTHPFLRDQEAKVLRAEACASAAFKLRQEGFVPDVVIAHPGWGEALFIKDVFPTAKLIIYCEYYYAAEGQDVGFDPEAPQLNFEQRCRLRIKNATNLLSLEAADAAVSPTQWQKSTFPAWARDRIHVIHDGIDFSRLKYNPKTKVKFENADHTEHCLSTGDEVLTYVARNLEPIRGFHVFMRTLPEVLRRRPKAQVIVVGGDEVSYGHHAPDGKSWRAHMMEEVGSELDMHRVHFMSRVPYQTYIDILNISKVHSYWTAPFVLSWSLLEAAINGMPVLASDTTPVREFAEQLGIERLPFFNVQMFAEAMSERLAEPGAQRQVYDCPQIEVGAAVQAWRKFITALL